MDSNIIHKVSIDPRVHKPATVRILRDPGGCDHLWEIECDYALRTQWKCPVCEAQFIVEKWK